MIVEHTYKNNHFKRFNIDAYKNYLEITNKIDIPSIPVKHSIIKTGDKIINILKNKTHNIEGIYKHWYAGFYYVLLIEHNKSHGIVYWENINCESDFILNMIKRSQEQYKILQTKINNI